MAQFRIAELVIRVGNLEERVLNLTQQVQLLTMQRDAALNMAERVVLSACDVLSSNSNVSGWQVQNEMHAIMNEMKKNSFSMQDSWKNHQSTGHSNGADSHEMLDTLGSSDGTATELHIRSELGSQRADPLGRDGLIKFYMTEFFLFVKAQKCESRSRALAALFFFSVF